MSILLGAAEAAPAHFDYGKWRPEHSVSLIGPPAYGLQRARVAQPIAMVKRVSIWPVPKVSVHSCV